MSSRSVLIVMISAVLLTACMLIPDPRTQSEGPFLRPAALGPANGDLPASDLFRSATRGATTAASLLPPRLTSDGGRSPLPDAVLPGIGAVHALVVPLSLGDRAPSLTEGLLSAAYFGTAASEGTLSHLVAAESDGAFRLSFEVLPVLVHPAAEFRRRAPTL
ncbi:MAG: hypothetical protein M3483_04340, partial [Gemmatimonadota bacterium]|nr:hypothetical protein [Gemmatimonadota bacterium]